MGSHFKSTNPAFIITASQNGYLGVAIFFFLSGYGLMFSEMRSRMSFGKFFRRRLFKVYLPVLLATALWLPIHRNVLPAPIDGHNSTAYDLLYGFSDAAMWFIRVLQPLYIAFYLTMLLSKLPSMRNAIIIFLAGSAVFAIIYGISFDSIQKHSVPLFALGALVAWQKGGGLLKCSIAILSIGLLVSISAFATSHPLTGFVHCFFDYIILVLIVIGISVKQSNIKCPTIIAAISFDIYLVHFKVLEITSLYFPLPYFIAGSVIITGILAYVFYRLRTALFNNLPNKISQLSLWKK